MLQRWGGQLASRTASHSPGRNAHLQSFNSIWRQKRASSVAGYKGIKHRRARRWSTPSASSSSSAAQQPEPEGKANLPSTTATAATSPQITDDELEAGAEKTIPPRLAADLGGYSISPSIDTEIASIALPTLATLAADPLAALVSTGFVGRLGAKELASVGVALSVFNSVSKMLNMPLLSVTTSTVASALGQKEAHRSRAERISAAASSSILLALLIGTLQSLLLGVFGVYGLSLWGAGPQSPLAASACAYLTIRALAAPAGVLFLTLQGTFRGLGDTTAPFFATLLMNVLNIVFEYVLIWQLGWGVRGAALATTAAQAVSAVLLVLVLSQRCSLGLVGGAAVRETLQFLKPTGLLVLRTIATTSTFAVATAIAARTDPIHTASHQIAFQVWLASSLLADSLAVAAQALIARALAAGNKEAARRVAWRCLDLSLRLGLLLLAGLALARNAVAAAFSTDAAVLYQIQMLMPFVFLTQPISSLAFVMDGILYGVSGYAYAARAMVAAAAPAVAVMVLGSQAASGSMEATLTAVWAGLAVFMCLRFATLFFPLILGHRPFDVLVD